MLCVRVLSPGALWMKSHFRFFQFRVCILAGDDVLCRAISKLGNHHGFGHPLPFSLPPILGGGADWQVELTFFPISSTADPCFEKRSIEALASRVGKINQWNSYDTLHTIPVTFFLQHVDPAEILLWARAAIFLISGGVFGPRVNALRLRSHGCTLTEIRTLMDRAEVSHVSSMSFLVSFSLLVGNLPCCLIEIAENDHIEKQCFCSMTLFLSDQCIELRKHACDGLASAGDWGTSCTGRHHVRQLYQTNYH